MSHTDRERPTGQRVRSSHEAAINRVAPLPIEPLPWAQITLGDRRHVSTEADGGARRFAPKYDRGDGEAKLKADEVRGPVQRRVATRIVRDQTVVGKPVLFCHG